MAFDYVVLDGKKYAVMADGYKPYTERQRSYDVGLTGKAIIQDFTVQDRVPSMWSYRLKVYIDTIEPDKVGYGNLADFEAAYHKPYFLLTDHFGYSHAVGIPKGYTPTPRVSADLGVKGLYGVFLIDLDLIKLYGTDLIIPSPVTSTDNLCYLTDELGRYLTDELGRYLVTRCQPNYHLVDTAGNPLTNETGLWLSVTL